VPTLPVDVPEHTFNVCKLPPPFCAEADPVTLKCVRCQPDHTKAPDGTCKKLSSVQNCELPNPTDSVKCIKCKNGFVLSANNDHCHPGCDVGFRMDDVEFVPNQQDSVETSEMIRS